jgi:hypothetical protein
MLTDVDVLLGGQALPDHHLVQGRLDLLDLSGVTGTHDLDLVVAIGQVPHRDRGAGPERAQFGQPLHGRRLGLERLAVRGEDAQPQPEHGLVVDRHPGGVHGEDRPDADRGVAELRRVAPGQLGQRGRDGLAGDGEDDRHDDDRHERQDHDRPDPPGRGGLLGHALTGEAVPQVVADRTDEKKHGGPPDRLSHGNPFDFAGRRAASIP